MNRIYLAFLLLNSFFLRSYAQLTIDPGQLKTINTFYDGYNSQDYDKMRSSMSAVIKLILTESKVRNLYSAQYQMLGHTSISKIIPRSERSYIIYLKYDRDTTEVQTMGISLSGKNKIIGFSSPSFKVHLARKDSTIPIPKEVAIQRLDSLLKLKSETAGFNGCILAIRNGTVFYENCAGYSDLDTRAELNTHTLFDLASCGKQFTAMAVMMLQQQGKLNYNNNIVDYFPDFPYKNITIENLLTHTSGVPDYMELFEKHWDSSKTAINKDVLDYFIKYKPKVEFSPGKEYAYSNSGYVILSSIIEKISGKTFADYLQDNIFRPLGMRDSKVYNTKYTQQEVISNFAKGYTYSSKTNQFVSVISRPDLNFYRFLDGITGDGAVCSTISDLVKWENALRAYTLVSKETFSKAMEPFKTTNGEISNYGFGWELQLDPKYERVIYHSGNWGGNITFILHLLDNYLSVVVLSNNEYFNTPKFAISIANIINGL